jgi:ribose 5-phosphate isomerase RpiB
VISPKPQPEAAAETVAVCADNLVGVTDALIRSLQRRGFALRRYGALAEGSPGHVSRPDTFRAAAAEVPAGRSVTAVLCSWTGAGAAIDGMTVPGVRAAYCTDAETARRTRGWASANVLAISLRLTSETMLEEILDGWFEPVPGLGPAPVEVPHSVGMGHAVLDQVIDEGHSALAVVLQPVERYDAVRGALLVDTVLTYCAQGYSFARTAEVLRSHPNTIRYRLDKVRELTGLDHRVAEDLVVLTLCARLLGGRTWNTRARLRGRAVQTSSRGTSRRDSRRRPAKRVTDSIPSGRAEITNIPDSRKRPPDSMK